MTRQRVVVAGINPTLANRGFSGRARAVIPFVTAWRCGSPGPMAAESAFLARLRRGHALGDVPMIEA